MTFHFRFLSTVLLVAFVAVLPAACGDAEKPKSAPKPPAPLTLEQIKTSIGKNKAAVVDLKVMAAKNNAEAQVFLGDSYMKGVGVYQNYSMAWNWYIPAAEKGHAGAQYKLGVMYREGKGAPVYPDKSMHWLQSAARQGYGPALSKLKSLGQSVLPEKKKI
ncbi:MAG: tetratricopeptide repeat protein [Rhodospirillales bacterium]